MTTAILGLGANLGDRSATLADAVAQMADDPDVRVDAASPTYVTPPWGDEDQPEYLNAVVRAEAPTYRASDWLELAQRLEAAAGRVRDPARRYGPRILDVDVIAVWDEDRRPVIIDGPDLQLPHPRAHLRAFVLVPWARIDPDAELPGRGPVRDLLRQPAVAADVPSVRLAESSYE